MDIYPKFPNFIISYPYPKIIIISMSNQGYCKKIVACGPEFWALGRKAVLNRLRMKKRPRTEVGRWDNSLHSCYLYIVKIFTFYHQQPPITAS